MLVPEVFERVDYTFVRKFNTRTGLMQKLSHAYVNVCFFKLKSAGMEVAGSREMLVKLDFTESIIFNSNGSS